MIEKAVAFSKQVAKQVAAIVKEPGLSSTDWSRVEINDIRKAIKDHYVVQQEYRCCYCRKQILAAHGRVWDVEHVISRDENPKFMFEPQNLAVSCIECNGAKRATRVTIRDYVRFPRRSQSYLLVHPHFDEYSEHVDITGENTYQALSDKGKFTIYHCNLFRYWQREASIRKPIRDVRFERDIGELRFAKSLEEAAPILASIQAVLSLHEAEAGEPVNVDAHVPGAEPENDDASDGPLGT